MSESPFFMRIFEEKVLTIVRIYPTIVYTTVIASIDVYGFLAGKGVSHAIKSAGNAALYPAQKVQENDRGRVRPSPGGHDRGPGSCGKEYRLQPERDHPEMPGICHRAYGSKISFHSTSRRP